MYLSLVSINHRTAPVEIREKVAVRPEQLGDALSLLRKYLPCGVLLSTCNRTEVYATTVSPPVGASLNFLSDYSTVPIDRLTEHALVCEGERAVLHLFQVAAGLDSLIVGEHEVLGQVGKALDIADGAGTVILPLRQLFQSAIRAGRRVREETLISRNALSVSSVAVELAAQNIRALKESKLLVIGAGEAGRLVARAARERGVSCISVTSRTETHAEKLAEELGGTPFPLDHLDEEMATVDIVVACADAPHRVLSYAQVSAAVARRHGQPLVIIDIAMPRNVDPSVGQVPGVYLYNMDELTQVSEQNRKQRAGEMKKAEKIIGAETEKFMAYWRMVECRPLVSALMTKAEEIRASHLDKTIRKLRPLSNEEKENLESMTRAIVTRILHDPIEWLKMNGNGRRGDVALVSELFHLDEGKPGVNGK